MITIIAFEWIILFNTRNHSSKTTTGSDRNEETLSLRKKKKSKKSFWKQFYALSTVTWGVAHDLAELDRLHMKSKKIMKSWASLKEIIIHFHIFVWVFWVFFLWSQRLDGRLVQLNFNSMPANEYKKMKEINLSTHSTAMPSIFNEYCCFLQTSDWNATRRQN